MCTMYVGLSYIKITKFRNLDTPLIAIFTHAASEPAYGNYLALCQKSLNTQPVHSVIHSSIIIVASIRMLNSP